MGGFNIWLLGHLGQGQESFMTDLDFQHFEREWNTTAFHCLHRHTDHPILFSLTSFAQFEFYTSYQLEEKLIEDGVTKTYHWITTH